MKCEECIHFMVYISGDGYHEPLETEYCCNLEDEDEDIVERYLNEKETACPYYDAGLCEVCGKHIGKGHIFWAIGPYSDFKCCSQECQKRI